MIEIPGAAVKKFMLWSKFPDNQNVDYDKRFVQALLLICIEEDLLAKFEIDETVMTFIYGMLIR